MPITTDVIVIGAGHNSLVFAGLALGFEAAGFRTVGYDCDAVCAQGR